MFVEVYEYYSNKPLLAITMRDTAGKFGCLLDFSESGIWWRSVSLCPLEIPRKSVSNKISRVVNGGASLVQFRWCLIPQNINPKVSLPRVARGPWDSSGRPASVGYISTTLSLYRCSLGYHRIVFMMFLQHNDIQLTSNMAIDNGYIPIARERISRV